MLRAIVGIVLFESAYMAEVVRGGLQAIPRGQCEAAVALGLSKLKTMALIVLPQALKHVIPGIVNTFIALFKDTSLVSIIGIFELLNTVRAGRVRHGVAIPHRRGDRLCLCWLRVLDILLRHVPILDLHGKPAAYRT